MAQKQSIKIKTNVPINRQGIRHETIFHYNIEEVTLFGH